MVPERKKKMNHIYSNSRIIANLCLVCSVHMYNITNEADLHGDLFSGYNTELRPGNNRDFPLNVSVVFHVSL